MALPTLEDRVAALEQAVAQLMSHSRSTEKKTDWRSVCGMFVDDPAMEEIDEEGHRIREADRRRAQS